MATVGGLLRENTQADDFTHEYHDSRKLKNNFEKIARRRGGG